MMMKRMLKVWAIGWAILALGAIQGCAHTPPARASAAAHAGVSHTAPAESARQIPAVLTPPVALASLVIEDKRAGYFINNTRFSDTAGEVLDLCRFSDTGYVTYTLGDSDILMRKNSYVLKARNMAQPGASAIKLGTVVRERGTQWIFKANDGKQIEA
ncbi:MAG: hypothetical protein OEW08_09535, partial [Gammaproteobacteria bacterium]|nr:hypothetical protein [Gammaproteobacteria bacterium]